MRPHIYHEEKYYPTMNPHPPMADFNWMAGRDAWLMNQQYGGIGIPQRLGSPLDSKPSIHNSALPGYSSKLRQLLVLGTKFILFTMSIMSGQITERCCTSSTYTFFAIFGSNLNE